MTHKIPPTLPCSKENSQEGSYNEPTLSYLNLGEILGD